MWQKYSLGHQFIVVVYAQTHLHIHSDLVTNPLTNMFWRGKTKETHMDTWKTSHKELGMNRRPQDAGCELKLSLMPPCRLITFIFINNI